MVQFIMNLFVSDLLWWNGATTTRLILDYLWTVSPETVFALHTDFGESGACMTYNVQLTAGQKVSVENEHSSELYGEDNVGAYNSWFTGFLLFPL